MSQASEEADAYFDEMPDQPGPALADLYLQACDDLCRARALAVALGQDVSEAERLLWKVVRVACDNGLALILNAECQDALGFISRDVTAEPACDCDGGHAECGYAHRPSCAQEVHVFYGNGSGVEHHLWNGDSA